MRLIDADALLEREVYYDRAECLVLRYEIEKAPTIEAEPVRYGRWIDAGESVVCSECGGEADSDMGWHGRTYYRKPFCGYCGAKMDLKGD